jgi:hypothetical protein
MTARSEQRQACRDRIEGKEMNRLMKFVEQGAYGEKSGRTAFAWKLSSLPPPLEGMDWRPASSFNAADELVANAGLTKVFKITSVRLIVEQLQLVS